MFYHDAKWWIMGNNFARIFSRIRKFCQRYYQFVSMAAVSWLGNAKVFGIIGLWNCKMIQLRPKSCQIVIFTIFAMRNIHSMTPNVYVFYFDPHRHWGTEKCQHYKKKFIQQFWLAMANALESRPLAMAIYVNLCCYQSTFLTTKFCWDDI